ncbi:unnamed protein product, partial [Pylaiella littoralis]
MGLDPPRRRPRPLSVPRVVLEKSARPPPISRHPRRAPGAVPPGGSR